MARTTINSLGIPADTIVSADLDYPLTDFSSTGIDDNATSTAITIDSSENTTFAGTITSGDITVADATPFIRLQDSDVTNGYTQISNVNGNAYIGARNDSADGSFLIGGYGGGTFTEFARWNEVGNFTQLGLTTFTGDVLISEATPGITLDDSDNANAELKIIHSSGSSYYRARGVTGYGAHIFQRNNDGATHLNVFATNLSGDAIFYGDDGSTQGMFWDASTERLGIGTTSPSRLLTLSDSGDAIFSLVSTTANTCQVLFGDSVSDSVGRVKYDNSDNSMALFTSQTERMRINSVGNVLIGRTDATLGGGNGDDLQIGSGSGGAGLTIHSSTSGNGDIQFADGTSGNSSYRGLIRYKHADDEFELWTAGARRVTLDSSGKVGIGTAGPNYALDVVGAIRATNSSGSTIIANRTSNPGSIELQHSGTQTANFQAISGGGVVTYIGSSPSEAMRITSSGNVGIGTASPATPLHINGTTAAQIRSQATTGYAGVHSLNNSGNFYQMIDNSTGAGFSSGAYARIMYSDGAYPMAFYTNANERMRIDSSGNVGIGTSSINSSYKLNVEGAVIPILAKSSSTGTSSMYACVATARPLNVVGNGSGYGMNMNNSSGSMAEYGYIGGLIETNTASSHSGALIFAPTSSGTRTERMRIDSNGQVGIGTTPSYTLDIQAIVSSFNPVRFSGHSSSIDAFLYTDTAYWSIGDTAAYGGNLWGGNKTSNFVHAHTNGVERMRIDSNGQVGIGATTSMTNISGYAFVVTNDTTGGGLTCQTSGSDRLAVYNAGNDGYYDAVTNHIFRTGGVFGGSERMRIDSSGNIGINQSAPDAQLTLNPPNYTSTATGGMIKWKNSNNSGHSNIQSYFVSGQGTDLNIGANAYINTSGAWSRWSTGLATSAIACRRDGNINFVTNSSSGNGITRAAINPDGQLLINRSTSITTGVASKLCITGNIDIDGNPGSTNVIRMHQSATEMGQIYGHTTGLRFYNFSGYATSIKAQGDATLQLIPGAGGNDAHIQLCGNGGNIATEGFEIWYDNDVGDVHLNTTYGNDVSAIRFHTRVGASKSTANERLTITGGGDVGISATSPSAIISSSRILQVASGGNTTLSVRSTDAVNDRSAILELLSSGNGGSKSIILYGDTDTTPGTPSPLVFQGYHSGARTERMRILPTGGITFNGDTATANALDDYEEGTYTPIYYGSSSGNTGTTYTSNTGVYTKIGRTVTVWIDITISAQSGNSGTPFISLPFTSGSGYGTNSAGSTRYDMGAFISWQTSDNFTGTRRPTGWITNNSGVMQMYGYTTAGVGGLTAWTLNTTGRISGKIIYTAAF